MVAPDRTLAHLKARCATLKPQAGPTTPVARDDERPRPPPIRLSLPPRRLGPGDLIRIKGERFRIVAKVEEATGTIPLTGETGAHLALDIIIEPPPAVSREERQTELETWSSEEGED